MKRKTESTYGKKKHDDLERFKELERKRAYKENATPAKIAKNETRS